jgi:hypothetical protein
MAQSPAHPARERNNRLARKRQVILLKLAEEPHVDSEATRTGDGCSMVPLGACAEVVRTLAPFNVAPDGSGPGGMGEALGTGILYGPGMIIEMPTGGDEISQLMVSVTDEDFAWAVLMRMCKLLHWKMLDPESGRTFG